MLDELTQFTSTELFREYGGMKITETSIRPWEKPDTRFIFELWTDDFNEITNQTWEVTCTGLAQIQGIPIMVIPGTELKLYDDHPVLWELEDEVYFTITGKPANIAALMGELFIEHSKASGNWVDFFRIYNGLPEALATLRESQLRIPARLQDTCFNVLKAHGVQYRINEMQRAERKYKVLFFSKDNIWPDNENFKQHYIIAEEFSGRRIG
jgi:hypothetical protein